jgi:hypothetical protein
MGSERIAAAPGASAERARKLIRVWLALFIIGLVLSGLTAFPLQTELELLARGLGAPDGPAPDDCGGFTRWIVAVRNALQETYARYPFIAYGTDWLAFAHLILGLLFIGPWRDPVRNTWVITFGLWACALVIPTALLCGAVRGIPFGWRLIDCSFGVCGAVPLLLVRHYTRELAQGEQQPR